MNARVALEVLAASNGWEVVTPPTNHGANASVDKYIREFAAIKGRLRVEVTFDQVPGDERRVMWAALRIRPDFCASRYWHRLVLLDCTAPLVKLRDDKEIGFVLMSGMDAIEPARVPPTPNFCLGFRNCDAS